MTNEEAIHEQDDALDAIDIAGVLCLLIGAIPVFVQSAGLAPLIGELTRSHLFYCVVSLIR